MVYLYCFTKEHNNSDDNSLKRFGNALEINYLWIHFYPITVSVVILKNNFR